MPVVTDIATIARKPLLSNACPRRFDIHLSQSYYWKTKAAMELSNLEWLSWLNHHRLLEPIAYIPPAEAEINYYQQQAKKATVDV